MSVRKAGGAEGASGGGVLDEPGLGALFADHVGTTQLHPHPLTQRLVVVHTNATATHSFKFI